MHIKCLLQSEKLLCSKLFLLSEESWRFFYDIRLEEDRQELKNNAEIPL